MQEPSTASGSVPLPFWESLPIKMYAALTSEAATETAATVVGSNFENLVIESVGVDVLVLVTAKWCQHCTAFVPHWLKLVETLTLTVSTMKTYQMDGEKNEIHGITITSYPTLLMFPGKCFYKVFNFCYYR